MSSNPWESKCLIESKQLVWKSLKWGTYWWKYRDWNQLLMTIKWLFNKSRTQSTNLLLNWTKPNRNKEIMRKKLKKSNKNGQTFNLNSIRPSRKSTWYLTSYKQRTSPSLNCPIKQHFWNRKWQDSMRR